MWEWFPDVTCWVSNADSSALWITMKFHRRLTTSKVQRFWRSSITTESDLCRRWLRFISAISGNDSVSGLSGKKSDDRTKYCRTALFCDSFGYADVPFSDLYGDGQGSGRKTGGDCRCQMRRAGIRDVCSGKQLKE